MHPPPTQQKTIANPACGTGGFFLAVYDFLSQNYCISSTKNGRPDSNLKASEYPYSYGL
jgi:type I restriction-modification system DNA methylase subunit